MREILTINQKRKKNGRKKPVKSSKKPTNKRAQKNKGKGATMAKKKGTKKKGTTRRKYTRNQSKGGGGRGKRKAAKNIFERLKILDSVVSGAKQLGGMMATQLFAKNLSKGGGANDPNWTWENYLWGTAGAFSAGIVAELIKAGAGKDFLSGGLSLLGYKLVTNELAQKSDFVSEYFGQADEVDLFLGTDGQYYAPGDNYLGDDGEVYLMGKDGVWRPTSDDYRNAAEYLGPPTDLGQGAGTLAPVTSLGESTAPPTSLGEDPYLKAFGGA